MAEFGASQKITFPPHFRGEGEECNNMHTKFLICRVTLYYLGVAKIVRENPHDASGQQFSEMCQRQKRLKPPG